jgi:GAF domain-containing protein
MIQNDRNSRKQEVLNHLLDYLGQAGQGETILAPFLEGFLHALHGHWPQVEQLTFYIRAADGVFRREASLGIPVDTPTELPSDLALTQALATRQPIMPAPSCAPGSWIIPIGQGDTVVGALEVVSSADEEADPSILSAGLFGLSGPLSLALRQLQAAALLEAMSAVSHLLDQQLANTDTLQAICRLLVQPAGLCYMSIAQFQESFDQATIIAEHPPRLGIGALADLAPLTTSDNLHTGETPLVINVSDHEDLTAHWEQLETSGCKTMMLLPLLAQGNLSGFVLLASSDPAREFGLAERRVFQAVATQIAASLRNTTLFTEIQRRANQLERIATFGRLITSTFEEHEIFRQVVDVLPNLLPTDQVSITFFTAGYQQMRHVVLHHEERPTETHLATADSAVERIVATQTPLLVTDVQRSEHSDHQQLAQQGFRSAIMVPLVGGGRALGTINLCHKQAGQYTATDLTLLQQFGNQIAIALENARQFQIAGHRAVFEESLSNITTRLQQQTDLRSLLRQTMLDLGQVLGAQRGRAKLQPPSGPAGTQPTRAPRE